MELRTESLAVMAAGLLALLLSGCGGPVPETSGSGAATVMASPDETASAATDATPADPVLPSANCETALSAAEYARLADSGHVLIDNPFLLGSVMERMVAEGALACVWSVPNSDVAAWYARLDVGDGGGGWLDGLEAEGWLEDTARGDGTYLAPADYDSNYQPSVQLSEGVLHFASYNLFLESVLELQ